MGAGTTGGPVTPPAGAPTSGSAVGVERPGPESADGAAHHRPHQSRAPGLVRALLLPADQRTPVAVLTLPESSVVFSDTIGGGLLDDALDGEVDGTGYVVYLDLHRVPKALPTNQRAAVLAARLGHVNRRWLADLRGDALIVGVGPGGSDADVPAEVVDAAKQAGILIT